MAKIIFNNDIKKKFSPIPKLDKVSPIKDREKIIVKLVDKTKPTKSIGLPNTTVKKPEKEIKTIISEPLLEIPVIDNKNVIVNKTKEKDTQITFVNKSKKSKVIERSKIIEKSKVIERSKIIEKPKVIERSKIIEKPKVIERSKIIEKPKVIERSKIIEKPKVVKQKPVLPTPPHIKLTDCPFKGGDLIKFKNDIFLVNKFNDDTYYIYTESLLSMKKTIPNDWGIFHKIN